MGTTNTQQTNHMPKQGDLTGLSTTNIDTPATASDWAQAIGERADGQFTTRINAADRIGFATTYGGPFFAIARLVPELSECVSIRILIVDSDHSYAIAAGRWLSLYAKARQPPQALDITICTTGRTPHFKHPKPILFQAHHQVLHKPWDEFLRNADHAPDLIIGMPSRGFDEIIRDVPRLCLAAPGATILVPAALKAGAILMAAMLRAYGFDTGTIISFDRTEGEPQHFAKNAWWLRATVPPAGGCHTPDESTLERFRQAGRCLQDLLNKAENETDAGEIAASIGTRTRLKVRNRKIHAILSRPRCGVDLATGRVFETDGAGTTGKPTWTGEVVDPAVLSQAPPPHAAPDADEDRLQALLWLGAVYADSKQAHEADKNDANEELGGEPIIRAEPAPPPDAAVTSPPAAAPDSREEPRQIPVPNREPRQLEHGAGTVNVLALAAVFGNGGQAASEAFVHARDRVIRWLRGQNVVVDDAETNAHLESPTGEASIETDGRSVWSLRFDDRRTMTEGAIWRTEITLLAHPKNALGVRMLQIRSNADAPPPVASSVPKVIADIADHIGLMDAGTRLRSKARRLSGEANATQLETMILNPERVQPVIVIAGNADASADRLAHRLAGLAHITCIDTEIARHLAASWGDGLAPSIGSVRLYRPGFRHGSDSFDHPHWPLKGVQLPKWLADIIFEEACAISVETDLDERTPSFQYIRQHLARRRLQSSEQRLAALRQQTASITSNKEEQIHQLQELLEETNRALIEYQAKVRSLETELADTLETLSAARSERDKARRELRHRRYQYQSQWGDSDPVEDDAPGDESYYPENWDELETWLDVYGKGNLVVLPQAAKAARESPFKDIPLAYKALEYLAVYYVPMRTRSKDDDTPYKASLQALGERGLELGAVGSALDDSRYKLEYRREYNGKTIWLDNHLKKGVEHDPTSTFRMYFHYDETSCQVIIGHFPTHLSNRIS